VARSKTELAMMILALIGILLSLYATTLHYGGSSKLCDINSTFSCDTVNKSQYSELLGIPVAILGLIAYAIVLKAIFFRKRIQKALAFTDKDLNWYVLLFVAFMFLFQLWLTFAEIFLIKAYCIVCLGSQLVTLLLLILAWKMYRN
jgi:uncharacterized membrane protein